MTSRAEILDDRSAQDLFKASQVSKRKKEYDQAYLDWCGQRDSNSHGKFPLGPQPSLSTSFSMAAYAAE